MIAIGIIGLLLLFVIALAATSICGLLGKLINTIERFEVKVIGDIMHARTSKKGPSEILQSDRNKHLN